MWEKLSEGTVPKRSASMWETTCAVVSAGSKILRGARIRAELQSSPLGQYSMLQGLPPFAASRTRLHVLTVSQASSDRAAASAWTRSRWRNPVMTLEHCS